MMCRYSTLFLCFFCIITKLTECYSYGYQITTSTALDEKQNINHGPQKSKPVWIDPFDMSGGDRPNFHYDEYNPHSNEIVDPLNIGWKDSFKNSGDGYSNGRQHSANSKRIIIYQQFINIFLKAMALKDTPEIIGSKTVQLDLIISGHDLRVLQNFGSDGEKSASVEQVSHILNKIFTQSKVKNTSFGQNIIKMLEWLRKTAVKVLSSPEWTIITSMLSLLFVVLWLVFVTGSYRLAFFCSFFLIFIAGFGINWMRLYEEKQIERYYDSLVHGDAPYHCKGLSLAWYQTIYYYWFGDDCLKFYKRRDVRPILKISPTDVFSMTLSSMIIEPAKNAGQAYGNFIHGIISHVPWYVTPIAVPLAFIIPLLFSVVIMAFFFNYRLSLSITGIHLLPTWTQRIPYRRDNNYVEDISHRANESHQIRGVLENAITDCKKPLCVLMNMSAIKTVFSNFSEVDMVNDNISGMPSNTGKSGGQKEDSKKEDKKSECDSCKRRTKSTYTSTSGSSSGSSSNDIQNTDDLLKILPSGSGDQGFSHKHDNEKEMCLNKSKIS